MKNMIFMFGYPIKNSTANALPACGRFIARLVCLILICASLFVSAAVADNERRVDKKSLQEKRAIEQHRKQFKSLPPAEREKVKNRYKWYKDLPPEKQKEIRDRWKKSDR